MVHNVTCIPWLQFTLYVMLFPMTHILQFDTKIFDEGAQCPV